MKKPLSVPLLFVLTTSTLQLIAQTNSDSVYRKVDVKPQFIGGLQALEKFIYTQTKYPQEALNKKQEGIIEVTVVVLKDGKIRNINCTNNKHPELCNEVKRVIALMPKWIPAKVKEQAINAHHKIAIGFKLYNKQITYVIIPDEMEYTDHDFGNYGPILTPEEQVDEPILTFVEQMPEFNGDLYEYLGQNINYPVEAKENKIEGKVIVEFIVEKDGRISDVKALKKAGYGFDEEAIRVITAMPSWKPGKQNGKTVRVSCRLPVSFKLK